MSVMVDRSDPGLQTGPRARPRLRIAKKECTKLIEEILKRARKTGQRYVVFVSSFGLFSR